MASRGSQPPPPPVKDDREGTRRGEELIKLIERSRPVKPGAARRKAPPWLHILIDVLWDFFFG